jgi:hypothetical protein
MRTVQLGRQFDCIFVHDAVCYRRPRRICGQRSRRYAHCAPGGAALFCPDHVRENFQPSTDHGGHDGTDRSLRYLEWTWDPDPADSTYTVDYAYVLRDADGSAHVEMDRHLEGLFSRKVWLQLLAAAGFSPKIVPFDHSELEPGS